MSLSSPPVTASGSQPSRRWRGVRIGRILEGYALAAPFLILFALFTLWPLVQSLYLSFTEFNGIRAPEFTGLENFRTLFSDARFFKALGNTFTLVVAQVLIADVLGLMLALAFRANTVFNYIMRKLLFLPSVTSGLAVITIWIWIFTGESYGVINALLLNLGLDRIVFLANPTWSIPVLVIMGAWGGMGYTMVLFLAGLNAVPAELHEAAAIDGATKNQRFWRITLPQLRPTILFLVITGIIGTFQIFEAAYIMFGSVGGNIGGVLDSALFVVPYLYERGFTFFELGYASAIAWALFLVIFVITMINFALDRRFS
ncbi:sugar ABC transporter permease [soil metagenome]